MRIVFTTPRVSLPVRWSLFWTISTVSPRWIFLRLEPGLLIIALILTAEKSSVIIYLLTTANWKLLLKKTMKISNRSKAL